MDGKRTDLWHRRCGRKFGGDALCGAWGRLAADVGRFMMKYGRCLDA